MFCSCCDGGCTNDFGLTMNAKWCQSKIQLHVVSIYCLLLLMAEMLHAFIYISQCLQLMLHRNSAINRNGVGRTLCWNVLDIDRTCSSTKYWIKVHFASYCFYGTSVVRDQLNSQSSRPTSLRIFICSSKSFPVFFQWIETAQEKQESMSKYTYIYIRKYLYKYIVLYIHIREVHDLSFAPSISKHGVIPSQTTDTSNL